LRWVVKDYFEKIDVPLKPLETEERGESFEEIARNKAVSASINYEGFTIATDAGMDIPGLKGWNSLLTKRFIGKKDASDFERMDALLEMMKGIPDRRMSWNEAVAVAYRGKVIFSTTVKGAEGVLQENYDRKKIQERYLALFSLVFPKV